MALNLGSHIANHTSLLKILRPLLHWQAVAQRVQRPSKRSHVAKGYIQAYGALTRVSEDIFG